MIVMFTARRLKPGAWEPFRRAWDPGDAKPPGFRRAYHARNEARWGPMRWCERHPFQFAVLLLGCVAGVNLWRAGYDWVQVAGLMIQAAK